MRTYFHDFYRELDDGSEVKVTVEYTATPYAPGCSYGPVESCYPPEGGEVEIVKAWIEPGGEDAAMTDQENEKWNLWLMENADQAGHGDYYDEWEDFD